VAKTAQRIERRSTGKLTMFNNVLPLTGQRTILESLQIGKPGAKVTKACILEGELVAYDDSVCFYDTFSHSSDLNFHQLQKILPFHKIRKHVSRRGRFLNTEQDSLYADP
jgi:hypothetical protein